LSSRLNLAKDPFLNRKPVERFQWALWILGAVLLALNVSSYMQNRTDTTELRARSRGLEEQIEAEAKQILGLQDTLNTLGPQQQNARVAFLNAKIAQRTFPWGEVFDNIGEILPRRARLRTLNPTTGRRGSRRSQTASSQKKVRLIISGIAETDEVLYELLDAFFSHDRFDNPNLSNERRTEAGHISFSMEVDFLAVIDPPEAES